MPFHRQYILFLVICLTRCEPRGLSFHLKAGNAKSSCQLDCKTSSGLCRVHSHCRLCWDKMGTLGNDEDATRFIRACHSSLKSLGLRGFLLLSTLDSVLGRAWTSVFRKRKLANDSKVERETSWLDGDDVLQAYVGSFPYEQLFSFCFAAFHHGGSGSVAEAIRAGIPQIILPTVFDQQHWAERMQWLSVAKFYRAQSKVNRLTSTKTSSSWRLNF